MNDSVKKLQIQVLMHNNQDTLDKCFKSLEPLNSDIVIIDHGSNDNSIEIAKKYGHVIKMKDNDNRSDIRNKIVSESKLDWHMYIEPYEVIKYGHQSILSAIKNHKTGYRLIVSQGDVVTKPIRLWHRDTKMHFGGLCYESLYPEISAKPLNAMAISSHDDKSDYQLNLIRLWQANSPISNEPYYYEAMFHLSRGKYDDFIRNAERFLFRSSIMNMSVIMTRYYLSWVYIHVKKDDRQALSNLLVGLSLKPLMAEFWCLLGDIHYFNQKDFDKAYRFYDTAILLGRKRNTGDEWPVQLSRYGEYPKRMMESCKKITENRMIISRS